MKSALYLPGNSEFAALVLTAVLADLKDNFTGSTVRFLL
jgi:hypothetical protein